MREKGRGLGSELGSCLDPDPWKIFRTRILQNYTNPSDPDPQH